MKRLPEPRAHEAAQLLLPWLLAGTLNDAEKTLVENHLELCAQCRADLDWQHKLRAAEPAPDPAFDAGRALARVLPRLGPQPEPNALLRWWRGSMWAGGGWLRWTAAAQFAAIAVLAALLARPGDDYRALGATARAEGNLVVVFAPDTAERELRRIVRASGARVVDGPTVTDAYVLGVPATQAATTLARLRAEPSVRLAQPLSAGSGP